MPLRSVNRLPARIPCIGSARRPSACFGLQPGYTQRTGPAPECVQALRNRLAWTPGREGGSGGRRSPRSRNGGDDLHGNGQCSVRWTAAGSRLRDGAGLMSFCVVQGAKGVAPLQAKTNARSSALLGRLAARRGRTRAVVGAAMDCAPKRLNTESVADARRTSGALVSATDRSRRSAGRARARVGRQPGTDRRGHDND